MFISTAEKEKLFSAIKNLEIRIYALENSPLKEIAQKPRRFMSEEQKAHMSRTMKAIHARKKAERIAVGGTA
jgi:hypothetical protein